MFYYIEVRLLAHFIQWIKMHGETVKFSHLGFKLCTLKPQDGWARPNLQLRVLNLMNLLCLKAVYKLI
jgi:hypothetical protein